jgi:SAM-dependent methyltransferase
MTRRHHDIDFDKALTKGGTTYDGKVGDWWTDRCGDRAHQHAYRTIADRLRAAFGAREPKLIVEYACGPGRLLSRLALRFPKSKLIGIDGSLQMLELAKRRLERMGGQVAGRIELAESHLPNFDLPAWGADAVVFAFPNICPAPDEQPYYDRHGSRHPADRKVAELLGKAREADPDEETVFDDPKTLMTALLDAKVVSRNLRGLVRRGGLCLRAEYANAPRTALSELVNMRLDFESGALTRPFRDRQAEAIFKWQAGSYHRSTVIEDVYHQTGDESDRAGGYLMNILKAI